MIINPVINAIAFLAVIYQANRRPPTRIAIEVAHSCQHANADCRKYTLRHNENQPYHSQFSNLVRVGKAGRKACVIKAQAGAIVVSRMAGPQSLAGSRGAIVLVAAGCQGGFGAWG